MLASGKKWLVAGAILVIVSNIKPVDLVLRSVIDNNHYIYTNQSASWSTQEDFFENHVLNHPERIGTVPAECLPDSLKYDTTIYRGFSKNPLAFWRWRLYLSDPRYRLPYLNWREVKAKRGNKKYKCARV